MGWKPAGAPGASVAVGAAWILLESHLTKRQGWFSSSLNRDKSPDVIGSFPPICHKQIIVATASLETLLASGEVRQHFSWASGTNRMKVQREEGFCSEGLALFLSLKISGISGI